MPIKGVACRSPTSVSSMLTTANTFTIGAQDTKHGGDTNPAESWTRPVAQRHLTPAQFASKNLRNSADEILLHDDEEIEVVRTPSRSAENPISIEIVVSRSPSRAAREEGAADEMSQKSATGLTHTAQISIDAAGADCEGQTHQAESSGEEGRGPDEAATQDAGERSGEARPAAQ